MPFSEDELLPLSALQHYLFCPRQCALIHLEQVWEENFFTAAGRVLHERTHDTNQSERRPGVRIERGLAVRSLSLGISGQCDVVEFWDDGRVLPIEYKRGKPKAHRADEVQLCAQALCLEEMLKTSIPSGHLYYGKQHRRQEITFDDVLRRLTKQIAESLHTMIQNRKTPPPLYVSKKCDSCSLIELCQPKPMSKDRSAQAWFNQQLSENL
jgi:CRISPR-associated exonuclease Cas4